MDDIYLLLQDILNELRMIRITLEREHGVKPDIINEHDNDS
jgi:hypothetical protein